MQIFKSSTIPRLHHQFLSLIFFKILVFIFVEENYRIFRNEGKQVNAIIVKYCHQ